MLLTQNVYLIGAKAGVTEHAALGQQIGKIPRRQGCLQGLHQRDAHGADAGAHGLHFFNYSSPPGFGAQVVSQVLNDPELNALWQEEVEAMRTPTSAMRAALGKVALPRRG